MGNDQFIIGSNLTFFARDSINLNFSTSIKLGMTLILVVTSKRRSVSFLGFEKQLLHIRNDYTELTAFFKKDDFQQE